MNVTEMSQLNQPPHTSIGLIEAAHAEDFRLSGDDLHNYSNNLRPKFNELYQGYNTAASFGGHKCLLTLEQQPDDSVVCSLLFHLRGSQAHEAICFIETTDGAVYGESHTYRGSCIISGPVVPPHQLMEILLTNTDSLAVHRPLALAG